MEISKETSYLLYVLFIRPLGETAKQQTGKQQISALCLKGGNGSSAENYHPVSLTCQICKVFKTLVTDTMVKHLETNSVIHESQHGFRKGRSCLTTLLAFLYKLTGSIDSGDSIDVVFLDFARALD